MSGKPVSAGERMDRIYRHQRFIYDLTRRYYLLGRDQMIADLLPFRGDSVLEIGCGTGRNLIAAARKFPEAQLYGIDVSSAMLDTARQNIARARLSNRISIALADATAFDPREHFGVAEFDRVFCSYVLSMIPRWSGRFWSKPSCKARLSRWWAPRPTPWWRARRSNASTRT